ncbi:AMP-binding protein [bacterium]|nr:AMP-binding protein [bacterium]
MNLKNNNVLLLLEKKTDNYQNRVAVGIKTAFGWKEFTYRGLGLLSRKLGSYLINDLKLQKGERVAILSESKPEYGACVFASVLAGTTTVPLDIKLTIYELESILSDCRPTMIMVGQHYVDKALELQKKIDSIKHILVIDEPTYNLELPCLYTLPNNYDCKWVHRSSKSTAVIIYTSGTTGNPKGVEISFRNIMTQLNDFELIYPKLFPKGETPKILSILPMNHLFEFTVGFSTFLYWGLSVYYTQTLKPKDILSIMTEKEINFMVVVPAFLKLLKVGIENEINSKPLTKILFGIMFNLAKYIPSLAVKKMMFKKIHDKFGGHFQGCISGGAPIDKNVANFFETIGIKVYGGYGLSEASPVVSVNYQKRKDYTSVGKPLDSIECRIDEQTGEILLKGPSIMKGYYHQPELTAETIDEDGWLHTGDIGHLDSDGHIHITGRIKNMIVLSGGKKVFPEEVETVLEQSNNFAEVCVMGSSRTTGAKEGTEDVLAIIVPKDSYMQDKSDEELNRVIREEVKRLSMQLASYKRPVNIIVHKEPLPKTTTRKIKRKEVKELLGV